MMGSFNTTCAVSQQTIAPRDPCRVMAILQQGDSSGVELSKGDVQLHAPGSASMTCHYEGFWRPVGNFIEAVYADYGRVRFDLEGPNRQKVLYLLAFVLERSWVTEEGDNSYHDLPFNLAEFMSENTPALYRAVSQAQKVVTAELDEEIHKCWEYVWQAARGGRLYLNDFMGIARVLEFTIIHEVAYNALVDIAGTQKGWRGESMEMHSYLRQAIDSAFEVLDEDGRDWEVANAIREGVRFVDGVGYPLWDVLDDILPGLGKGITSKELSKEQVFETCLPVVRDRYALGGYTAMNLRLTPMVTAGQDYENELGRTFAKFIAKVSPLITRTRLERSGSVFRPYRIQVLDPASVDDLAKYLPDVDGHIDNIVIKSVVPVLYDVEFECSATENELREVMQKIQSDDRDRMLASLHVRTVQPVQGQ